MREGDRIDGTWVVDGALGRGGMGSVYRCRHAQSDRIYAAIKVLAGSLRGDDDAVARFVREAEILHRLDHPSVVKVRNVRVDEDPPYLEMEYVEGQHLGEVIPSEGFPSAQGLDYLTQVFEALAYLHANDVRHRDIKPENVLIRRGTDRVVLVDFGLALDASVTRLTADNMAFGTVAYAPPEWLKPSQIDPCAWDLYAAGVLGWEMLTGQEPFPASGEGPPRQQALQVMLAKQSAPPLDPGPDHPLSLRRVIRELTDPDPSRRPPSAGAVLAELAIARQQLDAGWEPGDEELPDTADPPSLRRLALEATAPRPPHRTSGALELPPPPATAATPWQLGAAVVVGVLLLAAAIAALRPGASLEVDLAALDDGSVPVRVALPELPNPERLALALDGHLPTRTADGAAWFDGILQGKQTVQWAYGEGCALNACPGASCPAWCGSDQVVVDVVADEDGSARVDLGIDVPARQVSVLVKSLQEPKKGLFKRPADAVPWGWLAGIEGTADGPSLRFEGVPPGELVLLLALGTCPSDAAGCSSGGTCPSGCSSVRRTVKVSWEDGPLLLTSELPLPQ